MTASAIQCPVDASRIAPERLSGSTVLTESQKIREASRQFEAILVKQILDASQKTVIKSSFTDDSTTSSIYQDMVTTQLADSISRSGAFGLAQTFDKQLEHQAAPKAEAGASAAADLRPTSSPSASTARPPLTPSSDAPHALTRQAGQTESFP